MGAPGRVITFYSYKGGTGRTMALANVGAMLARQGAGRILMVDWDLEAPGLHSFFPEVLEREDRRSVPGVLELFEAAQSDVCGSRSHATYDVVRATWRDSMIDECILSTELSGLDMIKAGRLDDGYRQRVNSFDWERVFDEAPTLFKGFADELASRYEYVLIDSRTGLTDTSGICTTLLPERLVIVFTPNEQSVSGAIDLAERATTYRSRSPDLRPLLVFPLASRVEMSEEELRREWRYGNETTEGYQPQFELLFEDVYDLSNCALEHYFDEVQIQHSTRYAYGERVAVRDEETSDRLSLSRSYERFTRALLETNGPWDFEKQTSPPVDIGARAERVLDRLDMEEGAHLRRAAKARTREVMITAVQIVLGLAAFVLATYTWVAYPSNDINTLINMVLPIVLPAVVVLGVVEYLRREVAFGARYVLHTRAVRALARERSFFESRAGPYAGDGDPVVLLTERYEDIALSTDERLLELRERPGRFKLD